MPELWTVIGILGGLSLGLALLTAQHARIKVRTTNERLTEHDAQHRGA